MTNQRPPSAAGDDLIFHDYHLPAMRSAEYTIAATQSLGVRRKQRDPIYHGMKPVPAGAVDRISGSSDLTIRISGPQLNLPQGTVTSTFPANMASGQFAAVLPHVTLDRSSLPWERLPHATAKGTIPADEVAPWLVLMILDEDEMKQATVTTSKAGSAALRSLPRDDVPSDELITLLTFQDPTHVAALFPMREDLPWLAHVRTVQADGGTPQPETATILANRMPTPGLQSHAFLLSVEGRYPTKPLPDASGRRSPIDTPGGARATPAPFPVLHQWTFFCEDEPVHELVELLTTATAPDGSRRANDPAPLAMPASTAPPPAAGRIATGMIAVRHELRNGDVSAAWYHGPLLPGRAPVSVGEIERHLPADQADDLMFIDEEFAMFDLSYAAAWELGRMLLVQEHDLAHEVYLWKRSFARWHDREHRDAGISTQHRARRFEARPQLPAHLANWVGRALLRLGEVPFRYLIPDEELLPPSAMRFFDVDAGWLECLRDGALSVGRTDTRARELDLAMRAHLPSPPQMSGFLLRSSAVADFPHLEFDVYDGPTAAGSFATEPLPIVRAERLSPSVLMVLVEGRARIVDFHLHQQAVHFGFEATASTPGSELYNKTVRHPKPVPVPPPSVDFGPGAAITLMRPGRCIDVAGLANALPHSRPIGQGGVADFALCMLEGVPLVRFERTLGAAT